MTTLIRLILMVLCASAAASTPADQRITLNIRDTEISEVMEMLSKQQRVNILLSGDVAGKVSASLYELTLPEAIEAIANAAGYAAERRGSSFFILSHDQVGRYANGNITTVKTYHVNYADVVQLGAFLEPYLSQYGSISTMVARNVLVVEDKPEFVARIDQLMMDVDQRPRQVLIEARILEVTLDESQSAGIDWQKLFQSDGGAGRFGTTGFAGSGASASTGFVFELINENFEVLLTALETEGKLQTLSSPKLVALDGEEATVVIGDRRGYTVTTTINQVTTESIEFLESGVILRVLPHIDDTDQLLLEIHPEVSTGTVDANGIPSQTTTEVTTKLLIPDGETIFIGGLIKNTDTRSRQRVPVLGHIPGLGLLFSSRDDSVVNTETVVLITPHIVHGLKAPWNAEQIEKVSAVGTEPKKLERFLSK